MAAPNLTVKIGADTSVLERGLNKADQLGRSWSKRFGAQVLSAVSGFALAHKIVSSFTRLADLGKTADALGLTVKELQMVEFAANEAGIAMEKLAEAYKKGGNEVRELVRNMSAGAAVSSGEDVNAASRLIGRFKNFFNRRLGGIANAMAWVAGETGRPEDPNAARLREAVGRPEPFRLLSTEARDMAKFEQENPEYAKWLESVGMAARGGGRAPFQFRNNASVDSLARIGGFSGGGTDLLSVASRQLEQLEKIEQNTKRGDKGPLRR